MPLSKKDSEMFFQIWNSLIAYTASFYNQVYFPFTINAADKKSEPTIQNYLWQNSDLILPAYLDEYKYDLTPEKKDIVRGFSKYINGSFIIERITDDGAIFMTDENSTPKIYLVKDLKVPWNKLLSEKKLPVFVQSRLLPFKGMIVCDGLAIFNKEKFSSKDKYVFDKIYSLTKEEGKIITSL
jgi:hypothetical protein